MLDLLQLLFLAKSWGWKPPQPRLPPVAGLCPKGQCLLEQEWRDRDHWPSICTSFLAAQMRNPRRQTPEYTAWLPWDLLYLNYSLREVWRFQRDDLGSRSKLVPAADTLSRGGLSPVRLSPLANGVGRWVQTGTAMHQPCCRLTGLLPCGSSR